MTEDGGRAPGGRGPVEVLEGGETSLLETVDSLLNRGVLLSGDLVLGLADVDLVYLRLETLLAAADRVLRPGTPAPPAPDGDPSTRSARSGQAWPRPSTPRGGAERAGEGLAPSRAEAPLDASAHTLRDELEHALGSRPAAPDDLPGAEDRQPPRWNADPEDVERSVARLVLALVEFLRKLMERQSIRRMEEGTLTEDQVERLGQALMRLEETIHEMARRFGLRPEELNLDLGPLGRLS